MVDAPDEWVRKRLRDRKLYKCVDVRAKIAHDKDDAAAISSDADTICAGGSPVGIWATLRLPSRNISAADRVLPNHLLGLE